MCFEYKLPCGIHYSCDMFVFMLMALVVTFILPKLYSCRYLYNVKGYYTAADFNHFVTSA